MSTHTHASICSFRACTKQQVVVLRVGIQETTSFVVSRVVPRVQVVPVPQQAFFLPCRYRDYNPFSPSVRTGVAGAGPEDKACFFPSVCAETRCRREQAFPSVCADINTCCRRQNQTKAFVFVCASRHRVPGAGHQAFVVGRAKYNFVAFSCSAGDTKDVLVPCGSKAFCSV